MVRKRHRYITVDVNKEDEWIAGDSTRSASMTQALFTSIKNLYGIQGVALAKTGLFIEFLGAEAKLARITMRRSAYKIVTSSLQFVTIVGGSKVTVQTLHTAATIRHSNLFAEKYLRRQIEAQLASTKSPVELENLKLLIGNKITTKKNDNNADGETVKKKSRQDAATSKKLKQEKLLLLNKLLDS